VCVGWGGWECSGVLCACMCRLLDMLMVDGSGYVVGGWLNGWDGLPSGLLDETWIGYGWGYWMVSWTDGLLDW
jgi:hypothetical protein